MVSVMLHITVRNTYCEEDWKEISMAGCSIVVLMSIILAAGMAVLVTILGISAFFFVLGIILLILSFTVLKKEAAMQKHRGLRIACMIIGGVSLLIGAIGIFLLAITLIYSLNVNP